MGRPSSFTQEIADAICDRLADGEALRDICKGDDMPGRATVFRWLASDAKFAEQYALAREAQADALADDIVAIADEDPALAFSREKLEGSDIDVARVDSAAVAHQRNRIDARKWVAAKLKPRKYGDQLRAELTGAGGGALLIGISTDPKPREEAA